LNLSVWVFVDSH